MAQRSLPPHESVALRTVHDDGPVREVHRPGAGAHVHLLLDERLPEAVSDYPVAGRDTAVRSRVLALPPGRAARRCDQARREAEEEPRRTRGGGGALRGQTVAA